MPLRSEWLVLYGAVAVLYLFVAWREWLTLQNESARPPVWHAPVLALAVGLHGVILAHGIYQDGQLRFGFAHALSATLWLTALIVWIESFFSASRGLFLLVLPLAAITTLLPLAYPGAVLGQATDAPMFRVHLLLAIMAYSLLTIAAMHALLMASMDRRLHGETAAVTGGRLAHFLDRLPPLLAMETVLFRLIGAGFLLLTATLVSGIFFSEEIFGRALRFDHKTVFTFAAWIIFGALLVGRIVFGWRGRTALRWTLTGFAMLMLAYVGSRFVLEVLLQRP
jgi:ABC-type uncharacterized transport system permease subunit